MERRRTTVAGIRDITSCWYPIRNVLQRPADPNNAIFPHTWTPCPENPKVLYNPGESPHDPLKGAYLPEEFGWMLLTRYGGDEAVKWRVFEISQQQLFYKTKVAADIQEGVIDEEGFVAPVSTSNTLPTQSGSRACSVGIDAGSPDEHDPWRLIDVTGSVTGFILGDAIASKRGQAPGPLRTAADSRQTFQTVEGSRKRRADHQEPDIYVGSDYTLASASHETARTAPVSIRRPISWLKNIMSTLTGALTRASHRLFEIVLQRPSGTPERRTLDQRTGNVTSKRRKVSPADLNPRWVSSGEIALSLAWASAVADALRHTVRYIHQSLHHPDYSAGVLFSAEFQHIRFSRYFGIGDTLTQTADLLQKLYSPEFLETITATYKSPQGRIIYPTTQEDIRLLRNALGLLENYPYDLIAILQGFRVTQQDLKNICVDLRAVLDNQPVPSLVEGFAMTLDTSSATALLPSEGSSLPPRAAAGAVPTIPGAFPDDKTESSTPEESAKQSNVDNHESHKFEGGLPLPYSHKTIPLLLIKDRLIDPSQASTYGRPLSGASLQNEPLRSILRSRPRLSASLERLKNETTAKKSVRFPSCVATDVSPIKQLPRKYTIPYASPDSFYRRYPIDPDLRNPNSAVKSSCSPPGTVSTHVTTGTAGRLDGSPGDCSTVQVELKTSATGSPNLAGGAAHDTSPSQATEAAIGGDGKRAASAGEMANKPAPDIKLDPEASEEEEDVLQKHEASILERIRISVNEKYFRDKPRQLDMDEPSALFGLRDLRISEEKEKELEDFSISQQLLASSREAAERAKAEALEAGRRKREEEEKLRKTGGLREPRRQLVEPLSGDWIRRVRETVGSGRGASGTLTRTLEGIELRRHDFSKVVPAHEWLNDEIVNGSLQWLDHYVNSMAGVTDPRSQQRKCVVLNSFLWKKIQEGGNTERALRRLGVSKANFLNIETVLVPICEGNHWTLIVVRPSRKSISHMDSLNPFGSSRYLKVTQDWVQAFLKEKYDATEWKVVRHDAPLQTNGHDCGVHTITNGMCLALGLNPIDTYVAEDMPLQRLRLAAMLLNQGFKGDFDLQHY